jgi:hypothetical protein
VSKTQPVRAADIPGRKYVGGEFNAEKCIAYLRGIGVEIDDATGDSWLTTQAVHRFLRRMKRPALVFWRWTCECGEMEGFSVRGERAPRPRGANGREPSLCGACGTGFRGSMRWYEVTRDGTERDFRPKLERFSPFDWRSLLEYIRNA